ncbi:MAG: N-formylglutamate amidohydrolase, partial [Cyanobacteria bacterium J06638_22]
MPDPAIIVPRERFFGRSVTGFIENFNSESEAPVLIVCDHGGRVLPDAVGDLGVSDELTALHIGWDIGAADVTRNLARGLGAPAIINHVSRLVIDPNRRPYIETSIPLVSDRCVIPGNRYLSRNEVGRRIRNYFLPYHRAVARRVGQFRRNGIIPVIIAVHSYTGRLNGEDRPW